ncbi:MAG: hypothetical protein AMJ78_04475 [Omnitrophica WOR_2 bacterium SM23_29]|nr:MAG: hypothetical protein AMJ78_04475 [Omnitrophica WOR_2 bacterium SM23_29]
MLANTFAYLGKENALKEEALEVLKKRFLSDNNADLDYSIFYSDQLEPQAFQDAVNTQPFLSPKRFVVVRDIEKLLQPTKDSIISYIKNPSKDTILVLMTDLKIKSTDLEKDALFKVILKYARVQTFERLEGTRLNRYLIEKAASYKKAITEEAIKLLVEKLGNDLGFLKRAIEELSIYVGKNPKIQKDNVEALVGKSLEESVFTLTKTICSRQTARSLSILSGLLKESVSPENIIGAIGAEFRRILKVKYLMVRNRNQRQIQNELRLNWQAVGEAMRIASQIKLDDTKICLRQVLKADYDCKNKDFDKRVILESLVVKLCEFSKLT